LRTSANGAAGPAWTTKRSFVESQRRWLIFSNPPEYIQKRAVYNSAIFNRSRVMDLRPLITSLTDELLNSAAERGETDIVGELGYQLTIKVMGHILGIPGGPTSSPSSTGLPLSVRRSSRWSMRRSARGGQRHGQLNGFLGDLIQQRRRDSGDDLLSRSVVAMEAGT